MARDKKPSGRGEAPAGRIRLSEAMEWAESQGCTFDKLGTGDRRCSHRLMPKPCSFSDHRPDSSPAHYITWLRNLAKRLREEGEGGGSTAVTRPSPRQPWGATPAARTSPAKPKPPAKKPTKAQQQAEAKKADPKKPTPKKKPKKK